MKISYFNLELGKEYFIESLGRKYKMIFIEYKNNWFDYEEMYTIVWFSRKGIDYEFSVDDKFYDVEEIRDNAKKARQQLEKRSLNMVLKRLVNEQFEW